MGRTGLSRASGQSALAQGRQGSIGDTEGFIVVQVNGKRRAQTEAAATASAKEIETIARQLPAVARDLAVKTVKKVIFVPGKIINFVCV